MKMRYLINFNEFFSDKLKNFKNYIKVECLISYNWSY